MLIGGYKSCVAIVVVFYFSDDNSLWRKILAAKKTPSRPKRFQYANDN